MLLEMIGFDQHHQLEVQWVELQTKVGNLIVQPEHAPMILELQTNSQIRYCLDSSKQNTMLLSGGIVHITRTSVTILIDAKL